MCGIAGIVGAEDSDSASFLVQEMVGALARRGPDGEGIECWDQVVLGHRRLAIFDLSEAGKQPMIAPDRSVGVVFNGAIYNHRELRKRLEDCGYRFRSNADTEVLVHGYTEWGVEKLVSLLRGMFAFGIWDETKRKLFLVRDRLGVKPLVVAQRNGTIAFASTIRALRVAGFVSELNDAAIAEFLSLGFVSDERTIYRGAFKVPAASIVEWSNGAIKTSTYWTPDPMQCSSRASFDEAVETAEQLLLSAVETRLDADVPVGVLLSSGIDSALICWAVAKLGRTVTAYTVGTPGDSWDETSGARETAQAIGINHQVVEVTRGETHELLELVSAYAEPFACASALGMLSVSRAVASSAKVILTGDGGDDVFLGYPRHRHYFLAQRMAGEMPGFVSRSWLALRPAFPRMGVLRRFAALLDYATDGFQASHSCESLGRYCASGMLGDRLVSFARGHSKRRWEADAAQRSLADLLDYGQKTYFTGEYMTKVDGASMYYGVEARSPFLDQSLWEFASSLPFEVRLHRWRLKAVLRELAKRRIGQEVANRRKQGFGIPVQKWIADKWRPLAEDLLHESFLDKHGWINSSWALRELESASKQGAVPPELWYVLVLELWMRYENGSLSATL